MVSSSLHFHKLPLLCRFPLVSTVPGLRLWYGHMGQGQGPHHAWALSAFADDQDEGEVFQLPQLFNDNVLELDDLDGTHAVMVRA